MLIGRVAARAGPLVATAEAAPREHLIWQPGFGRNFAVSFGAAAALLVLAASPRTVRLPVLVPPARRLEVWSALGLASSSCCLLQLVLNAFSFGCAGFNTLLGPLRPAALALTCVLQGLMWRSTLRAQAPAAALRAAAGATALTAALSLLPELVALRTARPARGASGGTLRLSVGGMGCTACTAKVRSCVEAVEGVAGCAVTLETGAARVLLSGPVETEALLGALAAAGFPSAVEAEQAQAEP